MMKQRMGMIISAHPKNQDITVDGGEPLDDLTKLQDIPGMAEKLSAEVTVSVPPPPKEEPVVLSEDEGLFNDEEAAFPPTPAADVMNKELEDKDMDQQAALKGQAQDFLEDGDVDAAVQKFSEAMMIG